MKDDGILPGDIAVMARQNDVAEGEIAAVLIDDEATLKHIYRPRGKVAPGGQSGISLTSSFAMVNRVRFEFSASTSASFAHRGLAR